MSRNPNNSERFIDTVQRTLRLWVKRSQGRDFRAVPLLYDRPSVPALCVSFYR